MEELVANCKDVMFEIELALDQQLGAMPLPFTGMDKSGALACTLFARGRCTRDNQCPFRHIKGDRTVVCKHWLRGLCKKGDQCEFLHEYDMTKMPECYFYSRFNACSNKECPFLHIDPDSKIRDCPWYDRGFCRHGPTCRHRHTRRVVCISYLCGFCPEGPSCKFVHPKFDLPDISQLQSKKSTFTCHYCNESGHKLWHCPKMPPEVKEKYQRERDEVVAQNQQAQQFATQLRQNALAAAAAAETASPGTPSTGTGQVGASGASGPPGGGHRQGGLRNYRPLDEVTCFKCGEKGHYANKCPKGHLAFLSSALPGN
ncbi:cleavage and polyadenylation specificity factor subunit 4-like [Tropilaelaps mercedesae]|uniref:Cleavage and polyadenylation specificity factor subunit 4 n=1 Tax=Tropilaelaps mercedesae TaxID=418985 RepID=A0A1V9X249_9ACAR|nr:cleavage and polyadenylation specificity factor subunit 4-like [Tropilaelaps mercedesae]